MLIEWLSKTWNKSNLVSSNQKESTKSSKNQFISKNNKKELNSKYQINNSNYNSLNNNNRKFNKFLSLNFLIQEISQRSSLLVILHIK